MSTTTYMTSYGLNTLHAFKMIDEYDSYTYSIIFRQTHYILTVYTSRVWPL